jgi:hypothetical protein
MKTAEEIIKMAVNQRKNYIVLIPENCVIDKKFLGSMTNSEFIIAFREMQKLIVSIYDDIEKAPFKWGYSKDFPSDNLFLGTFSRFADLLNAIFTSGELSENGIVIDAIKFKKKVQSHSKIDLFINGLAGFGFGFENYSSKTVTFTVTYEKMPQIINALYEYTKAQDEEIKLCWAQHVTFESFSYRWVEDSSTQTHEPFFLVKTDMSPKLLKDIQYWLYDEAKKYGFKIDKKKPLDKNCIFYQKGSKEFLLVGEMYRDGKRVVFSKVILRKSFETHMEKINELAERMTNVFGANPESCCTLCNGTVNINKPCSKRIQYEIDGKRYSNCAYKSFYFYNPILEDIHLILELFLAENKIHFNC